MTGAVQPVRETIAREAIQRASQATGADFEALLATARRESSLNAGARAGTSSAAGLFQFIERTWLDMVRRHGGDHGMGAYAQALQNGDVSAATRREILSLRFDPELSARMAGELWRENASTLRARLGREPNAGELYAAHVMGPQGAARLIAAADEGAGSAAAIFPREAAANRHLFFTRGGEARSASELLQRLSLDVGQAAAPAARAERAHAPETVSAGDVRIGASGALSPALLDALMLLALSPDVETESDPALDLLRRDEA
ncbi:MAG: transglycosylase SLT domain-containing protein [Hyphomonadaceae bacterium]